MTASYALAATVTSVLYGFRAFLIFRDLGAKPYEICHQVWFNAACSFMGWLAGYWVIGRFTQTKEPLGVTDIVVLVFAALGIVGYLPPSLNAMPGLLGRLGQLAEKQLIPVGQSKEQK